MNSKRIKTKGAVRRQRGRGELPKRRGAVNCRKRQKRASEEITGTEAKNATEQRPKGTDTAERVQGDHRPKGTDTAERVQGDHKWGGKRKNQRISGASSVEDWQPQQANRRQ